MASYKFRTIVPMTETVKMIVKGSSVLFIAALTCITVLSEI